MSIKQATIKHELGKHASKVRPVHINEMRVPPIGVSQRPFSKNLGNRIAAALDLDKIGIPIVNYREGVYWLIDGQHRIHGLRENGFVTDRIDCEVYEGLSDAEAANIFIGRAERVAIAPYDKFLIACTAGYAKERDILRTVESNGLRLSRTREDGSIGSVVALAKVYSAFGALVLGRVLRAIKGGFAGDSYAFDGQIIQGLGLAFGRYQNIDEKDLATRLAATQYGARGLLRRAETQRDRTGNQKAQCVAAAVVEIYNKGAGVKQRLQPWWKTAE